MSAVCKGGNVITVKRNVTQFDQSHRPRQSIVTYIVLRTLMLWFLDQDLRSGCRIHAFGLFAVLGQ